MRNMIALLLVLIILASGLASGSLLVKPAQAQYSPPTPQFTLQFDNESYTVPATSTSPAYYVSKEFIDVIITNNNAYSFYAVVNESLVKLYYIIRVKDHYQSWSNCTVSPNLAPSNSNYTIVKFGLGSVNPDPGGFSIWIGNITNGNQVDFQVQGVDGFYTKLTQQNPPCWRLPQFSVFNETGASGWSNTQTINTQLSSESPPSPDTTIAPVSTANAAAKGISQTALTVSAAAILAVAFAGGLVYLKRRRKQRNPELFPSKACSMTRADAYGGSVR